MSVLWTINNLHQFLHEGKVSKPTMNVKDIAELFKHHSKKDSGAMLETLNMCALNGIVNFKVYLDFKISWNDTNS